jgi:hypothetical protein
MRPSALIFIFKASGGAAHMQKFVSMSIKKITYLAVTAALLCFADGARAGVEIKSSVCDFEILISGKIDKETRRDFEGIVSQNKLREKIGSCFMVTLNSPGGSVQDAMAIGEIVRELGFITDVVSTNQCSSACVLILASGVTRAISDAAYIGIHRPSFDEGMFASLSPEKARALYNEMSMGVRRYLLRMGVSDELYLAMVSVPSDELKKLSITKAREYGLEGKDPSWHEWIRAKLIQNIGKRQYNFNQSLHRVAEACFNSLGPPKCTAALQQYVRELASSCPQVDEASYIPCIKSFERQAIVQYRR